MTQPTLVLLRWNAGGNPHGPLDQLHSVYERRVLQAVRQQDELEPASPLTVKRVHNPFDCHELAGALAEAVPETVVLVVDQSEAFHGLCLELATQCRMPEAMELSGYHFLAVTVERQSSAQIGPPQLVATLIDELWVLGHETASPA